MLTQQLANINTDEITWAQDLVTISFGSDWSKELVTPLFPNQPQSVVKQSQSFETACKLLDLSSVPVPKIKKTFWVREEDHYIIFLVTKLTIWTVSGNHKLPFHVIGNFGGNENCTEMAEGTKNPFTKNDLRQRIRSSNLWEWCVLTNLQTNVMLLRMLWNCGK